MNLVGRLYCREMARWTMLRARRGRRRGMSWTTTGCDDEWAACASDCRSCCGSRSNYVLSDLQDSWTWRWTLWTTRARYAGRRQQASLNWIASLSYLVAAELGVCSVVTVRAHRFGQDGSTTYSTSQSTHATTRTSVHDISLTDFRSRSSSTQTHCCGRCSGELRDRNNASWAFERCHARRLIKLPRSDRRFRPCAFCERETAASVCALLRVNVHTELWLRMDGHCCSPLVLGPRTRS
ncbi:hypothetical protein EXIGLDRAFT_420376 [Exidia glandulosa HHB12029]|uniref:Uncharacterized protein n=1 Tax=Exidia glandulosa HHB12029 TaxID=1314781 RepID=A0A165KLH9_EXIGL|nr:hypothetical protein EXIGLDRAFT_420376 [Exidia glandulosa HHB12029]